MPGRLHPREHVAPAQAQTTSRPNNGHTRAPRALQHNDLRFNAYVNEKTGTPSWILDVDLLDFTLGKERVLSSAESVGEATQAFLAAYADAFGIHPDDLVLNRISSSDDLWFVSYRQVYGGIPVLGAEVGVTVSRDGRLVAAGVEAFPDLKVAVTPRLGSSAATEAARRHAARSSAEAVGTQELVIVPEEMEDRYAYKLAWQIRLDDLKGEEPFSETYLVDALSGDVIATYDNILEHEAYGHLAPPFIANVSQEKTSEFSPATLEALSTSPAVFTEAPPMTTSALSNSIWGNVKLNYYETPSNYTNPLIRHTDQPFAGAKVTVKNNTTLQTYTTYADASGNYSVPGLSAGSHTVSFEIANEKAYISSGLTTGQRKKDFTVNVSGATQKDYDWNWGDSGDGGLTSYALNGVYHVRDMYNYFKNTYGYNGMDATTHPLIISSSGSGTGAGSTNGTTIWLGGAEAMSSEVTLHEYAHDVIHKIYSGWIRTGPSGQPSYEEGGSMDEGLADYFAADRTNDQTYGGPQANADPFAPAGDGVGIRFLWNDCTMNDFLTVWPCGEDNADPDRFHNRGRIISGAVWRVRTQIGTEASHLLFNALQIAPLARTFEALRERYFAADNARNSGANRAVIEQKFTERYIGGPIAPSTPQIAVVPNGYPTLTWTDRSSVEDGYRIERKYNSGSWSVVQNLPPGSTSHTDNWLCKTNQSGRVYYRIQAYYQNSGHPDEVSYSPEAYFDEGSCSGNSKTTPDSDLAQAEVPMTTTLSSAYPNPFNPETTIRYTLATDGHARLAVYDVLGREVAVLADGVQKAGEHQVVFDAGHLPSGLYIYRLETADMQLAHTIMLAK